jgi:hypothetical protein
VSILQPDGEQNKRNQTKGKVRSRTMNTQRRTNEEKSRKTKDTDLITTKTVLKTEVETTP